MFNFDICYHLFPIITYYFVPFGQNCNLKIYIKHPQQLLYTFSAKFTRPLFTQNSKQGRHVALISIQKNVLYISYTTKLLYGYYTHASQTYETWMALLILTQFEPSKYWEVRLILCNSVVKISTLYIYIYIRWKSLQHYYIK